MCGKINVMATSTYKRIVAILLVIVSTIAFFGALPSSVVSAQEISDDFLLENQWYAAESYLDLAATKKTIQNENFIKNASQYENDPIVIAVVDTGIERTHPVFEGLLYQNPAELNGKDGIDDDANGYTDDICGWDFVAYGKGDNVPQDDCNAGSLTRHGTHVAGTIAQLIRGYGLEKYIKILPIKAGNSKGEFSASSTSNSILYAKKMDADIINMSFGSISMTQWNEDCQVHDAIISAYNSNILLFGAAGNKGLHCNEYTWNAELSPKYVQAMFYPAAYKEVFGVMAYKKVGTNAYDLRDNSNYGMAYSFVAPGEDIFSAMYENDYGTKSGTSMATPFVSFMSAVLLLQRDRSVNDVKNVLNAYESATITRTRTVLTETVNEKYRLASLKDMLMYQSDIFRAEAEITSNNTSQTINQLSPVKVKANIFDWKDEITPTSHIAYQNIEWSVVRTDSNGNHHLVETAKGAELEFLPTEVGNYKIFFELSNYSLESEPQVVTVEYAEKEDVQLVAKVEKEKNVTGDKIEVILEGYDYLNPSSAPYLIWTVNGEFVPLSTKMDTLTYIPAGYGDYNIVCKDEQGNEYVNMVISVKRNTAEKGELIGYICVTAIGIAVCGILVSLIVKRKVRKN